MKKLFVFIMLLFAVTANGQEYYNEWIDFSKTYYKFKVPANGLYRINQSTLAAAGLGSVPAENFQLFRNGVEVPLFTSVAAGSFGASDYIEFWGLMNDGKPDKNLYRNPTFQYNDKWSLETDSASYFLTSNAGSSNLRFASTANNVTGTTLTPEPYFMYKTGNYFRNQISGGYAVNVGSYMYSSSYDRGEGWTSSNVGSNATLTTSLNNLFPYTAAPLTAQFNITVSGTATNQRRYRARINGDSVLGRQVDYFNAASDTAIIPVSLIAGGSANVDVTNIASTGNDRLVVHKYELTYPRLFNFGGSSNFEFSLPGSATPKYLQISNFNYGATAPVLYDLTNHKRYVGDISTAGMVKFVVQPGTGETQFVLVQEEAANIRLVTSLTSRTFVDYAADANQGDYIIISNPLLFTGPGGTNPVEEYRLYRSSIPGGNHKAIVLKIEDLTDQFAFGIKKHPIAIRNFLQFARENFLPKPKFVLLIGKGVDYTLQRANESNINIDRLNLVPTFGSPASDVMLSSNPGSSKPEIPIGRISAINGQEVADYLAKVKTFEQVQQTQSPLLQDKAWMKNIVHVVGSSEPGLQLILYNYMLIYKHIIQDTFFGGKVTTFSKTTPNPVDQINSDELDRLFAEGITLITYFGHSGSSSLEFNLNNPDQYNNTGKYPLFIALGCNAGNFYSFNSARFTVKETLSESFVLAPNKGSIGFIASSHFGIPDYLHLYNQKFYESAGVKNYGKSIGEITTSAIEDIFAYTTQEDFYARATCEETSLHGDPALKLNPHEKPDYAVEPQNVRVSPVIVSVADPTFNVFAKTINIGKAINTNITREVKREYPDGTSEIVYRDTIPGIRYADSLSVNIPIVPLRDKGTNRITFTIDADNNVDELFENNNSVTKEFVIYENELRPVYPYDFAIVNRQNIKFYASTANPFAVSQTYRYEIDTTEKFNSPLLRSATKTSSGGVIEFPSLLTFTDSVVYYWRVSPVSANGLFNWNTSSFIYLQTSDVGFNQSHYYQHLKSGVFAMRMDSATRSWKFNDRQHNIFVRNGVFPTAASTASDLSVALDGDAYIRSVCGVSNIIVHVIDPVSFKAWQNNPAGQPGLYGSEPICGNTRLYNFQFNIMDTASRRRLMGFLDFIPSGHYVVIRNTSGTDPLSNTYASTWKADTNYYGAGNSIYHRMQSQGFTGIDSFYRPRAFIFTYKKNEPHVVAPKFVLSEGILDRIILSTDVYTPDSAGYVLSPLFGPAKSWKKMIWKGVSGETPSTDQVDISLIGIRSNGTADTLQRFTNLHASEFDISGYSAVTYPYMQLKLKTADTTRFTPFQLQYWRLTYVPKPEGAVAPNLLFQMKDTFELGEPIEFKLAFQNISDVPFDSLKIKVAITDQNNVTRIIPVERSRPLAAGDTIVVRLLIDNSTLRGMNSILVDINPDDDQPELHHFNNFIYKNFVVLGDTLNPFIDVTFDNVHIVSGDIVSSKPTITIKLKDDAKWRMLDDTSLVTVQVLHPDGRLTTYRFNTDTLQFIPAQMNSPQGNTATINFRPYFAEDGYYELIIRAKDKSNNQAGQIAYRVGFEVINKPMISNMLNYPNPFTSSTAFVFTITGSQVPQQMKIQILTITGKIVREITKAELGPLHIGRNITDFKWDGTDQYGRIVANGVYLYRIVTNLNGKSLDKYTNQGEKTDKFFNNGYGKMYLMR